MTAAQEIIKSTRSDKKRHELALERCKFHLDEQEVIAAQRDDGWSTTAIYEFADGSSLRENGMGWHAEG